MYTGHPPRLDYLYIQCTFTPMQLDEFMRVNRITDGAMAARVSRSRVTVNRWRRKLERPSSEAIPLIVAATNGEVTANELLGIVPQDSEPAQCP